MVMWQIWLIISGLLFIGEMITIGFLLFWPAIAALITMIISIFAPDAIILQMAIFVVSSAILIFFTKPLVNKYINKKTVPTNTYSLIGKKAIVVEDIKSLEGSGQVKVNGEIWSAKSDTEGTIEKGTEVEILQVDGVKLLVTSCTVKSQVL